MLVTKDEYVKGILEQILSSYQGLLKIKDSPGSLYLVKKEWLKIHGLLLALNNKLESFEKKPDYVDLQKQSKYYIENYDFQREIDTMDPLYSDDIDRLKNIRLKILESFNDKQFIEKIELTMANL